VKLNASGDRNSSIGGKAAGISHWKPAVRTLKISSSDKRSEIDQRHQNLTGKTIVGLGNEVVPRGILEIPTDNTGVVPALKTDQAVFYAWGEFRYRDTFDDGWCLEFRLQSVRRADAWVMQATPEGNEEIKGDCPNWPDKK
jgi:hypothetical protein